MAVVGADLPATCATWRKGYPVTIFEAAGSWQDVGRGHSTFWFKMEEIEP